MTITDRPGPEARYLAYLAEGRFMIQRAVRSGRYVFYPRVAEPGSGDTELEWVAPAGFGTVYSATTIHPKPPARPRNISIIELDEGPRLLSAVVGIEADDVTIGRRVEAFVGSEDGAPILLFRPVGGPDPR